LIVTHPVNVPAPHQVKTATFTKKCCVNAAEEPRFKSPNPTRYFRFLMLTREGLCQKFSELHIKEGALTKENGTVTFPPTGKRGAFVMEFPSQENPTTFSITVNDQPIFSAINLRKATFQSF
jgi:hypothetical protein